MSKGYEAMKTLCQCLLGPESSTEYDDAHETITVADPIDAEVICYIMPQYAYHVHGSTHPSADRARSNAQLMVLRARAEDIDVNTDPHGWIEARHNLALFLRRMGTPLFALAIWEQTCDRVNQALTSDPSLAHHNAILKKAMGTACVNIIDLQERDLTPTEIRTYVEKGTRYFRESYPLWLSLDVLQYAYAKVNEAILLLKIPEDRDLVLRAVAIVMEPEVVHSLRGTPEFQTLKGAAALAKQALARLDGAP